MTMTMAITTSSTTVTSTTTATTDAKKSELVALPRFLTTQPPVTVRHRSHIINDEDNANDDDVDYNDVADVVGDIEVDDVNDDDDK